MDESLGIYLGWTERSDSLCSEMPIRNEKGDVVLVFSGEEFPEDGVAQCLKDRGHDVQLSDLSYLVHTYEEDESFPRGLNGRFHGVVADRRRGTALLFNDRYGMQRLYYHEAKDAFYFAAEAKAILAICPELRRIDALALGQFVSCGSVLENRTLFKGIEVLPGASAWRFRDGKCERRSTYFLPKEWEEQEALDLRSFGLEIERILATTLPRYFRGRARIAMSLTGGLDTRIIMARCKPGRGSLPCYTFGGMRRDCWDVIVARQVARACGQEHEVIPVGRDFLSQFPRYAERTVYLTDGCVDVGRSPDLYLNERAREMAPIRMTGNYGGELLRRVRAFKPVEPLGGLFTGEVLGSVDEARKIYGDLLRDHPVSFAVFKQCPWHHYGVLGLEQTQIALRSPFLDNDLVRMVFRAPREALANNNVSLRLIKSGNPALLRIPTDRGLGGERGCLVQAASHMLRQFQFKAEYAYDMGMPQWLARADHAVSSLSFERLFLGRHKIFHFRVWFREELAEYVREVLLDPISLSRPYLERRLLERVVDGHLRGHRNYTDELSKLLTLELIHRVLLDNPQRGLAGREGRATDAVLPHSS